MQDVMAVPTYDEVQNFTNNARFAMDSKLYVRFYIRPVMNAFRSSEEGRPIYDEKEYINVIIPGDSKTTVDCPVNDEFRRRFQKQYDQFKRGIANVVEGTPLEMWPQMSVGLVAELKAMNVLTIEQLAGLSDSVAQKIMGFHDLRRKAQSFLDAAKGEAESNKLARELEKRDDEIATLKLQMQQLMQASMAQGTNAKKKE